MRVGVEGDREGSIRDSSKISRRDWTNHMCERVGGEGTPVLERRQTGGPKSQPFGSLTTTQDTRKKLTL